MTAQPKRSFTERLELDDSYALELVTGNDEHGRPSYALLLLPANKVNDLRRALANRDVVLEDFGEVLAKGEGLEPPEDMVEEIQALLTRK